MSDSERAAFKRGQREASIDAELDSHEKRLNAINGSIERNVREAANLRRTIEALGDRIDEIAAHLATKAAVETDRNDQLKRANDQQISNRTFWLGVTAIIVTLIAAFVASGRLG